MSIMFGMFNGWEIVAILGLALILFGAKKLPELARGLGQGIREFKRSTREVTDELENSIDFDSEPPKSQQRLQNQKRNPSHAAAEEPEPVREEEEAKSGAPSGSGSDSGKV